MSAALTNSDRKRLSGKAAILTVILSDPEYGRIRQDGSEAAMTAHPEALEGPALRLRSLSLCRPSAGGRPYRLEAEA